MTGWMMLMMPALLAVTACADGGHAPSGGSSPPRGMAERAFCPGFSVVDRDANGFVDASEFGWGKARLFEAWDGDRNGRLSTEEFTTCVGPNADGLFATLDADGDRTIGHAEFLDRSVFIRWDRDGDRRIGEGEFRL